MYISTYVMENNCHVLLSILMVADQIWFHACINVSLKRKRDLIGSFHIKST